ncbi:hypothetical protein Tco_0546376 [Tanacetum coccineum]
MVIPSIKVKEFDQAWDPSGIRSPVLGDYFDLGIWELEHFINNSLQSFPYSELGEYEMWEIRISRYFSDPRGLCFMEVIVLEIQGPYSYSTRIEGHSTALKMTVPSTTEEKICKKNDVKARSLLLMALPNEHQLTFNQYADAQSMFIAIKARLEDDGYKKKHKRNY